MSKLLKTVSIIFIGVGLVIFAINFNKSQNQPCVRWMESRKVGTITLALAKEMGPFKETLTDFLIAKEFPLTEPCRGKVKFAQETGDAFSGMNLFSFDSKSGTYSIITVKDRIYLLQHIFNEPTDPASKLLFATGTLIPIAIVHDLESLVDTNESIDGFAIINNRLVPSDLYEFINRQWPLIFLGKKKKLAWTNSETTIVISKDKTMVVQYITEKTRKYILEN